MIRSCKVQFKRATHFGSLIEALFAKLCRVGQFLDKLGQFLLVFSGMRGMFAGGDLAPCHYDPRRISGA